MYLYLRLVALLIVCVPVLSYSSDTMDGVKFTDPRKVKALYQLMKDVHELFEAGGIRYWIDSGTLLGAVRHTGLIAWDDDLDLCIDTTDQDKLVALKPLLKKLGFTLILMPFGWTIKAKGCCCDIFLMKQKRGKVFYADYATQTFFAKRDGDPIYYTDDELFPLKRYTFGALSVWGPQDPYPYLNAYYKDWATAAKFLVNHATYKYSSKTVILTDKEKVPAEPFGPLEDRVKLVQEKKE